MSDNQKSSGGYSIGKFLYFLVSVCTSMIGYTMHKSIFWSVIDFIFTPLTWLKWMVYKEITLQIIKDTFSWFFN